MNECDACDGRGWRVMTNSEHGLRIERCDACDKFASDELAIEHVAWMASLAEEAELT